MPPIGYDLFHEKLAQMKAQQQQPTQASSWTCPYTNRQFKSEAAYNHYLKSAAYRKLVEKHNRAKAREQISGKKTSAAALAAAAAASIEDDEDPEEEEGAFDAEMENKLKALSFAQDDGDEDNDQDQEDETYDEDEAEEPEDGAGRARGPKNLDGPIPVGHSLFNTMADFPNVKSCLDYMLAKFGFYIPFVDFLVDLEGLLEYLGYKIGVGHICIYCNKPFKSTQAVQTHMRQMGHCMINLRLPSGAEDEDYFQFYEFSHNLIEEEDEDGDEDYVDEDEEGEEEEGEEGTLIGEETKTDVEGDTVVMPKVYRVKLTKSERRFLREQQRVRTLQLLGKEVPEQVLAYVNGESDILPGDSRSAEFTRALMPMPAERARALKDIHSTGELELTDGTLIGHRDYKIMYQQMRASMKDKTPAANPVKKFAIQRALAAQYLALSVPGYAKRQQQKATIEENKIRNMTWLQHCVERGIQNNVLIKKYFRHQNPK